jgi:hypothetical protein
VTRAFGAPAAHARLVGPTARAALHRELDRLPVPDPAAFVPFDPQAPPGDVEVVLCGALCGVDDLDGAVAALRSSIGDDGRLVFLEHVGRPGLAGTLQRAAGSLIHRLPGGCRTHHDVPGALRRGGFVVTDLERFTMPTPMIALRPWVRGVAVARRGRG